MGTIIKSLLLENSSMYACVFKDIENNGEKTSEKKQLTSIKINKNEWNKYKIKEIKTKSYIKGSFTKNKEREF